MERKFFPRWFSMNVIAIAVVLLSAQTGRASEVINPLNLFKRYFGTMEIASNGVGMRGTGQLDAATGQMLATATIQVPLPQNVPATRQIVSAWLYWETIEKTGAPSNPVGYVLDPNLVNNNLPAMDA